MPDKPLDPDEVQELRIAAAAWKALVEHAPDVIVHLDLDARVRWINRVPFDFRREDVVGHPFLEHVAPDYRDRMHAAFQSASSGKAASTEAPYKARDGRTYWFWCHLGPVRDDGGAVTGAIMVARDITERREMEHQLTIADRMASVGTMAAGVAHEINNPLASVIGNLELAIRAFGDREELRDAFNAAERVREIVHDLKLFAAAEDERRGPVDVRRVLDTALRIATAQIKQRAHIARELGEVPRVDANEARLGQVFLHLLINAAQAIPEGDPERHRIRVATHVDGAGRVVVTVADTGAGIPAEARPRIFMPFFTTKPVGVGTGLGLSISHQIVTALGGQIDFDSHVGKGTEFRITLPASTATPAAPPRRRESAQPPRRGRVLVIDDEPLITRTIRRILGTQHDVTIAENGEQGLAAMRGADFDVILCDLMMPVMSGMDLHAEVARSAPAMAARLVFMTGGAFTPKARAFLESVPNPRLDKPFDAAALRALVNGLLG